MSRARALRIALATALLAPSLLPAQSPRQALERRPFLILSGGFGVQGAGETSYAEGLGGPQASLGVGLRVARTLALRAEYGGQWFLHGAEPVYAPPCAYPGCTTFPATTRTEDLRTANLLAELRLRDRPGARTLTYVVAGPSLAWAPNDQGVPNTVSSSRADRSAPGATVGLGFGLRSAPGTDRALRLEARYTALTHAAAATHGIVGLVLGVWL